MKKINNDITKANELFQALNGKFVGYELRIKNSKLKSENSKTITKKPKQKSPTIEDPSISWCET